jgi:hypothetical protein
MRQELSLAGVNKVSVTRLWLTPPATRQADIRDAAGKNRHSLKARRSARLISSLGPEAASSFVAYTALSARLPLSAPTKSRAATTPLGVTRTSGCVVAHDSLLVQGSHVKPEVRG